MSIAPMRSAWAWRRDRWYRCRLPKNSPLRTVLYPYRKHDLSGIIRVGHAGVRQDYRGAGGSERAESSGYHPAPAEVYGPGDPLHRFFPFFSQTHGRRPPHHPRSKRPGRAGKVRWVTSKTWRGHRAGGNQRSRCWPYLQYCRNRCASLGRLGTRPLGQAAGLAGPHSDPAARGRRPRLIRHSNTAPAMDRGFEPAYAPSSGPIVKAISRAAALARTVAWERAASGAIRPGSLRLRRRRSYHYGNLLTSPFGATVFQSTR